MVYMFFNTFIFNVLIAAKYNILLSNHDRYIYALVKDFNFKFVSERL